MKQPTTGMSAFPLSAAGATVPMPTREGIVQPLCNDLLLFVCVEFAGYVCALLCSVRSYLFSLCKQDGKLECLSATRWRYRHMINTIVLCCGPALGLQTCKFTEFKISRERHIFVQL